MSDHDDKCEGVDCCCDCRYFIDRGEKEIARLRAEVAALKAERDRALEILSEVPSMLSVFHTSPCPGWNLGKDCDACRIALFGQQASKPAQEGKS